MDSESPESKAKTAEKRNVHVVHEHFESVFNAAIWALTIRELSKRLCRLVMYGLLCL